MISKYFLSRVKVELRDTPKQIDGRMGSPSVNLRCISQVATVFVIRRVARYNTYFEIFLSACAWQWWQHEASGRGERLERVPRSLARRP